MPQNMPTLTLQNLIQLGAHRSNSGGIRVLTFCATLRLASPFFAVKLAPLRAIFCL